MFLLNSQHTIDIQAMGPDLDYNNYDMSSELYSIVYFELYEVDENVTVLRFVLYLHASECI